MAELVHSINEVGLLQPVVVRRTGDDVVRAGHGGAPLAGGAGGRASTRSRRSCARPTTSTCCATPCWRTCTASQLNPLEEAAAYQQLLEDFGCTHDELASRIGRSRPQISNTIRLLKLSPAVQRRVAAGVISAGHARSLLAVEDPDLQDRLAARVVAEGISVRGLEEIVAVGETGSKETPVRRAQAHRTRAPGPRGPALRPARDPGQGRPRPAQGQDHRRVRVARRPAADRRHHGPAQPDRSPDLTASIDLAICRQTDTSTDREGRVGRWS